MQPHREGERRGRHGRRGQALERSRSLPGAATRSAPHATQTSVYVLDLAQALPELSAYDDGVRLLPG
jgi:hypothetical protein